MLQLGDPTRPSQHSHDIVDAAREYEHPLQFLAPTWNVPRGLVICRVWIYSHLPTSQTTQLPEPLVSCRSRDLHGNGSMAGEVSGESAPDALIHEEAQQDVEQQPASSFPVAFQLPFTSPPFAPLRSLWRSAKTNS